MTCSRKLPRKSIREIHAAEGIATTRTKHAYKGVVASLEHELGAIACASHPKHVSTTSKWIATKECTEDSICLFAGHRCIISACARGEALISRLRVASIEPTPSTLIKDLTF